jgi:hypothetical protein
MKTSPGNPSLKLSSPKSTRIKFRGRVDSRYGDFVAIMKPMVEYGSEFGKLDKELIALLPKSLKLIAAGGAGFDWADHEELGRKGTSLSYWTHDRDLVY